MGVALIEICDRCGRRFQGPTLPPVARSLQNAMTVLVKHLPGPGEKLLWACPTCTPEEYAEITPLEREVWKRAERRGAGEVVPDLQVAEIMRGGF
jgi:hypothetical protein